MNADKLSQFMPHALGLVGLLVLGALVYVGKMPAEALLTYLAGGGIGVFVPSPRVSQPSA